MAFHQTGMTFYIRMVLFEFIDFLADLLENIRDGLGGIAAETIHERIARFHVEFYGSNTGTVLSAVVLFFHQQVQLIEPPQHSIVLLMVIRERLS